MGVGFVDILEVRSNDSCWPDSVRRLQPLPSP